MECSTDEYKTISERMEDELPNTVEKQEFEKHMQAYFARVRRCNVYWATLHEIKQQKERVCVTGNYSPAFWTTVIYSFRMGLVTDIVAILGNDEESLVKYFDKIKEYQNMIYTRKFYMPLENDKTGEKHEEECYREFSNKAVLENCSIKLQNCSKYLKIFKAARDKVYCHLDKKSLSVEDCNKEIFSNINDDIVREVLDNIGYVIQNLMHQYDNRWYPVKYSNGNDISYLLKICQDYNKFSQIICDEKEKKIYEKFSQDF